MRRNLIRVLPLLLAACAQPDPTLPQQALEEALAQQRASLAGVGAAAPLPAAAAPAASAARQGGAPPGLAAELIGQTPEALRRMLGEPRLRRSEEEAEIWHYQASQCHLDLVLYPDAGGRAVLRVAFAQARAVGTARRGEAACLRDIARGAARPPAPSLMEQAAARV